MSEYRRLAQPLQIVLVFVQPRHLDGFQLAFRGRLRVVAKIRELYDPFVQIGVADMRGVELRKFFVERERDGIGLVPVESGHGRLYSTLFRDRNSPVDILPEGGAYSSRMSTQEDDSRRIALLQGTLDLLILRTLRLGSQHGQGIARAIQETSDGVLLVDHGSLYPALQRLEAQEWIEAEWGVSETNRKARFYKLTRQGRKQLTYERGQWQRLIAAMALVLGPDEQES